MKTKNFNKSNIKIFTAPLIIIICHGYIIHFPVLCSCLLFIYWWYKLLIEPTTICIWSSCSQHYLTKAALYGWCSRLTYMFMIK